MNQEQPSLGGAAAEAPRRFRPVVQEVTVEGRLFSALCRKLRDSRVTLADIGAVRWRKDTAAIYIPDPDGSPLSARSPFEGGAAFEELRHFVSDASVSVAMIGGEPTMYLAHQGRMADVFQGLLCLSGPAEMNTFLSFGLPETGPLSRIQWLYGGSQTGTGGGRVPLGWTVNGDAYVFGDRQGQVFTVSRRVLVSNPSELQRSAVSFVRLYALPMPRGAKGVTWSMASVPKCKGYQRIEAAFEMGDKQHVIMAFQTDGVRVDGFEGLPPSPKAEAPVPRPPSPSPRPLPGRSLRT